ncbi:hypothetical protein, partial [Pontibacter harenae]|uniref:hypothetical protein n=1 Tax=Pontibacter harenae TaxID=2894083 RepID=UPI001E3AA019
QTKMQTSYIVNHNYIWLQFQRQGKIVRRSNATAEQCRYNEGRLSPKEFNFISRETYDLGCKQGRLKTKEPVYVA